MTIQNLYSVRRRRELGQMPDVYHYEDFPEALRIQVSHIIRDAIGENSYSSSTAIDLIKYIRDSLRREFGKLKLSSKRRFYDDYEEVDELFAFFLFEASDEQAIDAVELVFKLIDGYVRTDDYQRDTGNRVTSPDQAIAELNQRFADAGFGYRYESGQIIRVDSQFIHAEVIRPALALLREPGFEGANQEFLVAHEHYRHGRHKESIVDSLKAFESTMKAICEARKWPFAKTDTAKSLIDVCLKGGLLPPSMQTQFSSVRVLLESGVPTVRNKNAGHGQGPVPIAAPDYLARYALNLTATSIVFLTELHAALP